MTFRPGPAETPAVPVLTTSPTKAVILGAGAGSRLGALTATTPKCLLPIDGRTLLDRELDALAAVGITDVTVVVGHMADRVIEHVGSRCRIVRNDRWASTNSIVSLHEAADGLRGSAFLLQNGDVLYPPAILKRLLRVRQGSACLVDPLRPWADGEYHVELRDGQIVRYSRDVPPARSVGESAQLVRVDARDSAAFLDRVGEIVRTGGGHEFPNRAYDVLMGGHGLWPVYTAGLPWWEIDTPADYERCRAELALLGGRPPRSLAERAASFMRQPRVPHRYRAVARALASGRRHPARAARYVSRVHSGPWPPPPARAPEGTRYAELGRRSPGVHKPAEGAARAGTPHGWSRCLGVFPRAIVSSELPSTGVGCLLRWGVPRWSGGHVSPPSSTHPATDP
ncbi:MAG TPA: phosphocholine cytidylyltransferase family protein [Methylomirabilota bacterium]|nr:phosphocholine cytidylyltransferase family protein [Methylomirabilota bacterium]